MLEILEDAITTDHRLSKTRIRLLLNAAISVGQSKEPDRIAEATLWLVSDALELPSGIIMLFADDQCFVLASQGLSKEAANALKQAALQDTSNTLIEQTLGSETPLIVPDLSQAQQDPFATVLLQEELSSLVCQKVEAPEGVLGVMLVGRRGQITFDEDDLEMVEEIVKQLNVCLGNAWLHTQSQIQLHELTAVTDTAYAVVSSLDS
ncbi:MAG: GAF domain-containing protein, partial [Chloroflexota bacterium]